MKRFVVDQSANVGITLTRTFILQVPDDCTQDEAERLVREIDVTMLFDQQVEWINSSPCEWDEVDAQETTLSFERSPCAGTISLPTITLHKED